MERHEFITYTINIPPIPRKFRYVDSTFSNKFYIHYTSTVLVTPTLAISGCGAFGAELLLLGFATGCS